MSLACTCSPGQRASGPSAQVFAATGWGPAPQALTASDAAGCSCLPPEGLRLAQSRPLFPVALPACLDICSPNNICHKSSPRLQGGLAGGRAAKPAPWLHKGASTTVCFLAAPTPASPAEVVCAAVSGAAVGRAPHRALPVLTHTVVILGLWEEKLFKKKILCILVYSRSSLGVFC